MAHICVCDCCGLCCQRLIVEADAIDVLREPRIESQCPLGHRAEDLPILEARWILAGPGQPCPFLTPENRCGIYPARPWTCVAFAAGSSKCQQLRQEHGLPALAALPATAGVLTEIQATLLDDQQTGAEPVASPGAQATPVASASLDR